MFELTENSLSKGGFFSANSILKSNKIYIVPNRYGLLYLIVIIIMILTGATYANNLIYLLGFFLFSVFVSGMVQTHSNISGVDIQVTLIEDSYESEKVKIHLLFKNRTKKMKQTLRVQLSSKKYQLEVPAKADIVEARKAVYASFEMSQHERGHYKCPRLKAYTNFPMGLFVSWMYQDDTHDYYIYPKPENFPSARYQLIGDSDSQRTGNALDKHTDSDFREHRDYRQGESYRHIDWKAYARKRPLLVKTFEGELGVQKIFDYSRIPQLQPEERLRQLSYWITDSLRANESFQLILPGEKTGMSAGVTHARLCLRALAMFEKGKS